MLGYYWLLSAQCSALIGRLCRGPGTLDSFNTALNQFVVARAEKLQFVSQGEKSYMAALRFWIVIAKKSYIILMV